MKIIILCILLLVCLHSYSQHKEEELPRFTLKTFSLAYHAFPRFEGSEYVEGYKNYYFGLGFRFSPKTYLNVGTSLNSFGDRIFLLGINHVWYRFSKNTYLEGTYSYAGEFFTPLFSHVEDRGYYGMVKGLTGLTFAPYIYHNLDMKINKHLSVEVGILLPVILVTTLQFNIY